MSDEKSELTALALERAPMVRILQEELDRFILARLADLMDMAEQRKHDLEQLFEGLCTEADLDLVCILEKPPKAVLTPMVFSLKIKRRKGKSPQRNVYIDTKFQPGDEQGIVCKLTTLFSSTGRPKGLSVSQLHQRLGDREGFRPPGKPHPKGTSNQQLWRSEVHLVTEKDESKLLRKFRQHLDSLAIALFEWERLCLEVEEASE